MLYTRKGERLREPPLLGLLLVLAGTILVSPSTLCHLPLSDQIGILLILFGIVSFLVAFLLDLFQARSGEPSPTGPTSNSQGASPSPPTTRHGSSSLLEELAPSGAQRSKNQDSVQLKNVTLDSNL